MDKLVNLIEILSLKDEPICTSDSINANIDLARIIVLRRSLNMESPQ